MTTAEKVQPRLKQRYREEIRDALNTQFNYANVMQIPGVVKVVARATAPVMAMMRDRRMLLS